MKREHEQKLMEPQDIFPTELIAGVLVKSTLVDQTLIPLIDEEGSLLVSMKDAVMNLNCVYLN